MFFYISLLASLALLVMRKYHSLALRSILIFSYAHQWDTTTVPPSYPMYP